MLSGAAGLLAGFSALSLPVLGVGRTTTVPFISARFFTIVLMLGLGLLASGLLGFSLMRDDPYALPRSENSGGRMDGLDSWKAR
jgi:hypothetical protein